MDEWDVQSWNNFDNDDTPAARLDVDDVVAVHICEDTICPACQDSRIIQNWKYPEKFCCIGCGLIFSM